MKTKTENSGSIVFQEIKHRLKDQIYTFDLYCNRFSVLLIVNSFLFGLTFLLGETKRWGAIALVVAILVCLIGIYPKNCNIPPNPRHFYLKYLEKSPSDSMDALSKAFIKAFDENKKTLSMVFQLYTLSLVLTFLGVAVLLIERM